MLARYQGWLKVGFSALFLGALFYQVGSSSLQLILYKIDRYAIAQHTALVCGLLVLQAVRWRLIGGKLGFAWSMKTSVQLTFVGAFFNQILPTSSGDVVRAWKLTRLGAPLRLAAGSVILDRVSALFAIMLMFCVGFPVLHDVLGSYLGPINMPILNGMLLGGAALAGALALAYRRLPALRNNRLASEIHRLAADAMTILRAPGLLLLTTSISLVAQIAVGYIVWSIAVGFGAELKLIEFSLLWPVVVILSMIPISIAGWGVREGAMVLAFHILGNPSSIALATSVTFGFIMLLASIPGGLVWAVSFSGKRVQQ